MQYSHSRLSTYENCPRQFAYRYVDKIEVDTEGVEAFVGKRVHEILERLYHHIGRYGRPPSLRQVLDRYHADWRDRWHEGVLIVRTELGPDEYKERGERCLENYYRAFYPFTDGQNVGIEARLHVRLGEDGNYSLVGVVDRIVRTAHGRYEIHDYKTGTRLPPQSQLDRERQLALYQIGLEQTYDDVESVELVWHYLVHNKTLRSRRTSEQLSELGAKTMALIDRIEATEDYPPRTSPLCNWCDYKRICPAQGGDATRPSSRPLPAPPIAARAAPPAPMHPEQLSLLDWPSSAA